MMLWKKHHAVNWISWYLHLSENQRVNFPFFETRSWIMQPSYSRLAIFSLVAITSSRMYLCILFYSPLQNLRFMSVQRWWSRGLNITLLEAPIHVVLIIWPMRHPEKHVNIAERRLTCWVLSYCLQSSILNQVGAWSYFGWLFLWV